VIKIPFALGTQEQRDGHDLEDREKFELAEACSRKEFNWQILLAMTPSLCFSSCVP
jgi:hypothetical protein